MQITIPVTKLQDNPFRNLEHYPIDQSKIEALLGSFDRTGWWENIVCRKKDGVYQLGYGHHRKVAFIKKYGKKAKIILIQKKLSDEDMLRMMADENMQEFGSSTRIEMETVRAVVLAYANGVKGVELNNYVPEKTNQQYIRYAPYFTQSVCVPGAGTHPYTAFSVAKFLGWTKKQRKGKEQANDCVKRGLAALEAAEQGIVNEEDIHEIAPTKVQEIIQTGKTIKKQFDDIADETEAKDPKKAKKVRATGKAREKEAVTKLVKQAKLKTENRATRRELRSTSIREKSRARRDAEIKPKKVPPTIHQFCDKLSKDISKMMGYTDERWKELDQVIAYRDYLNDSDRQNVVVALRGLSQRCLNTAQVVNGEIPVTKLLTN